MIKQKAKLRIKSKLGFYFYTPLSKLRVLYNEK